jgi:aryl-phospho-beta-D-glucosidase BglC (GH1 family)
MGKGSITISVGYNTTNEEIKELRELFKQNDKYKNYTLNVIKCGNNNFKEDLKNFIKAGIKS